MKLLSIIVCFAISATSADYWSERDAFIKKEDAMAIGQNIVLSSKEEAVNKILMQAKEQELQHGFEHPEDFPPARHFFNAKEDIEKSAVYQIIAKMPKGGALHIHDTGISSIDYVMNNISYREHLYACIQGEDIKFVFADPPVQDECYRSLKVLRQESGDVAAFDAWIRSKISLVTDKPYEAYPDINTVWAKFQSLFDISGGMVGYAPAFLDYMYNALEEFYKDNVNYVEIRGTLPLIYELNGYPYVPNQVIGMLKETAERFKKDHPNFLGVKYIYAPFRKVDDETMDFYLQLFAIMKEMHPDFLVGFDLVGQEDLGHPLKEFIDRLTAAAKDVKFYFHAGETNWNGMPTDTNLIDAILLNTTRIGHGFALLKHPAVLAEVKRRNIAVEVNPISHQVLNLIKDLRNHPASFLFAQDYPVVISSDDPGLWGANGLSHDFYEAFMGIAGAKADLRMLKQLGLNSLIYSSMNPSEKSQALKKYSQLWNEFIDGVYRDAHKIFH